MNDQLSKLKESQKKNQIYTALTISYTNTHQNVPSFQNHVNKNIYFLQLYLSFPR